MKIEYMREVVGSLLQTYARRFSHKMCLAKDISKFVGSFVA